MKTRILTLIMLFSIFSLNVTRAQDIEAGKKTFKTICAACHTLGKGKLVGPDLKGITDKLDHEWIKSFVLNSTAMIESGDEEAVRIFKEFNEIPMPANPSLTDEDLNNLIGYIADASVEKVETEISKENKTEVGTVPTNTPIVVTTPTDSVIDNPLIRMVFWGSVFIIIAVLLSLTAVFIKLSNNNR